MHDKIFQISPEPIEYRLNPDSITEYGEFADYIGDSLVDEQRVESCKHLASLMPEVLEYAGNCTFRYKGLEQFLQDWVAAIHTQTDMLTGETILKNHRLYQLRNLLKYTHLDLSSRFYIEQWLEYPMPLHELISFLSSLNEGDLLYVGSVIDFHW